MAVLGSVKYNKDPKKMPSYHSDNLTVWANTTTHYRSGDPCTQFWNQTGATYITSNSVANTARTVVNISGKAGFLTHCWSPYVESQSGTCTWVITVDGVATTVVYDGAGTGANSGSYHTLGVLNHGGNTIAANSASYFMGHVTGFGANRAHAVATYGTPYNTDQNARFGIGISPYPPSPEIAIAMAPLSCVRFENSLTVTVASNASNSSGTQHEAGATYLLDGVSS